MQFLFRDEYYDSPDWAPEAYARVIQAEIEQLEMAGTTAAVDIGRGASWPVVLAELFQEVDWSTLFTVAGATGIFLLGEKINKGLDGWLELARKVRTVIDRLRPLRIDEFAATVLVLEEVAQKEPGRELREITVQVVEFTPVPLQELRLAQRPDSLYIITIRTWDRAYVYGIKSNGARVFKHEMSTDWYEFGFPPNWK